MDTKATRPNTTASPTDPVFPSSQLDGRQLAAIGTAFLAGIGVGRGQFGQIGSPAVLPEDSPQKCIHRIPEIPLRLDGGSAAPESVKDFDGKPLYYVLDKEGLAGDAVQVFSSREKAQEFLALVPVKTNKATSKASFTNIGPGSSPQEIADAIGGYVSLFEHTNYGGAQWTFGAGTAGNDGHAYHAPADGNVSDFRRVLCFLWWCQNINDRVSSIQNNSQAWAYLRPQRAYAVLHEHISFAGSELWVPELASIADLVPYGWNDRASSLSYRIA